MDSERRIAGRRPGQGKAEPRILFRLAERNLTGPLRGPGGRGLGGVTATRGAGRVPGVMA